jgi:hypothetical protein
MHEATKAAANAGRANADSIIENQPVGVGRVSELAIRRQTSRFNESPMCGVVCSHRSNSVSNGSVGGGMIFNPPKNE